MKMNMMIVLTAAFLIFANIPLHAESHHEADPSGVPAAVIKDSKYEFEPVIEGKVVVHEFIVENTGTASLEIENIKTGCGCTTADFTRTIPPGGRGNITIKGNTNGYGGNVFERRITAHTNDPKNQIMNLFMKGKVDQFAGITPATAVLKGKANESVEIQVSVMPDAKHPFKVVDSSMDKTLEGKIEYGMEKFDTGYVVLRIRNKQQTAGNYFGRILLKTDNPDKPEIAIPVTGKIG
ncbi:MAG: DUF1573 domain-containing protein [Desulfobacteraceae bacterium]|nr:MAG: DUF1573 domain-containing protein [Desulfobacteraceae bacterium]